MAVSSARFFHASEIVIVFTASCAAQIGAAANGFVSTLDSSLFSMELEGGV
jgi:hypothetical protein